ncbi:MAG: DUF2723 domain-containing protein, partial [Planctomycetota bacterium]
LNLLSAVAGSVALALFYLVCGRLCGDRFLALLATVALGVSHTFWTLSVITEVYTFDLLFILILLLLALRWMERPSAAGGCLICFLFGLGLSDHLMIGLLGPSLLIAFFLGVVKGRFRLNLVRCSFIVLSLLAGLSPAVAIMAYQLPEGAGAADLWHSVQVFLNLSGPGSPGFQWSRTAQIILLVGLNFVGVALLAGAIGVARAVAARTARYTVLLVALGCFYLFPLLHPHVDTYQFCLGGHLMLALFLPLGFETLQARAKLGRCLLPLVLLVPPLLYAGIPAVTERLGIDVTRARSLPHRSNAWYFLLPPKCLDDGPRRYLEECFEQAAPDAVLVADFTPGMLLTYASVVEGARPDVDVITIWEGVERHFQAIDESLGQRPVFVAAAEPEGSKVSRTWYLFEADLRARYEVVACSPMLEVVRRRD